MRGLGTAVGLGAVAPTAVNASRAEQPESAIRTPAIARARRADSIYTVWRAGGDCGCTALKSTSRRAWTSSSCSFSAASRARWQAGHTPTWWECSAQWTACALVMGSFRSWERVAGRVPSNGLVQSQRIFGAGWYRPCSGARKLGGADRAGPGVAAQRGSLTRVRSTWALDVARDVAADA